MALTFYNHSEIFLFQKCFQTDDHGYKLSAISIKEMVIIICCWTNRMFLPFHFFRKLIHKVNQLYQLTQQGFLQMINIHVIGSLLKSGLESFLHSHPSLSCKDVTRTANKEVLSSTLHCHS